MIRTRLVCIAVLLTSVFSPFSLALPDDKNQPISISADSATKDGNKGITIYSGDVIITQGSVRITGDTITLKENNGAIQSIVTEGSPATFRQKVSLQGSTVEAEGNKLDYQSRNEILIITGNAKVKQDNRITQSNFIRYNISNNQINAGKNNASESGRVNMIIPAGG